MATPSLTVHHLSTSSSERIPWLCEELGLPYTLKTYARDPQTKLAPPEYKVLHPAGSAPVINDSITATSTQNENENKRIVVTVAESSACVQYICTKYAPSDSSSSSIFPSPDKEYYPTFLYWFHWANGTFQAALGRALSLRISGIDLSSSRMGQITASRLQRCLDMLEEQLGPSPSPDHCRVFSFTSGGGDTRGGKEEEESGERWLVGRDLFTAADIMVVFSLTTFRYWYPYSLAGYPHILDYLGRIGKREAYQKAMRKADPGLEPAVAMGREPPVSLW